MSPWSALALSHNAPWHIQPLRTINQSSFHKGRIHYYQFSDINLVAADP